MPYPCKWRLEILDDHHRDHSVHTIARLRSIDQEARCVIDEYGHPAQDGLWREMQDNCRRLTSQNPGLILQITRIGACAGNQGDNSRYYFSAGLMEEVAGTISFPPFNEKELH